MKTIILWMGIFGLVACAPANQSIELGNSPTLIFTSDGTCTLGQTVTGEGRLNTAFGNRYLLATYVGSSFNASTTQVSGTTLDDLSKNTFYSDRIVFNYQIVGGGPPIPQAVDEAFHYNVPPASVGTTSGYVITNLMSSAALTAAGSFSNGAQVDVTFWLEGHMGSGQGPVDSNHVRFPVFVFSNSAAPGNPAQVLPTCSSGQVLLSKGPCSNAAQDDGYFICGTRS